VVPKFLRRKFAGVQQPLGRWILRHVAEFIVLSPAILVTWLWLKLLKKRVFFTGIGSSAISAFIQPLEPEIRRYSGIPFGLEKLIILNLSSDANHQIRNLYDRVVTIYGSEAKWRRRLIWWSAIIGKLRLPSVDILVAQNDPLWHAGLPVVGFTRSEVDFGESFLRSIGVKEDQKIVCFATRTASYYAELQKSGTKLKPQSIRNPDEKVYFQVAKSLSERGYFVIRMGKDLDSKVPKEFESCIYDYASLSRSNFLDAYLLYRCDFLLNGGTGIFLFRAIFNLPSVQTDLYRILKNTFFGDIALFQKVWSLKEERLLTVREMVTIGDGFSDERHQERIGVRLVKNTAEEILAACNEMEARLNGTWISTEEDEVLQQKYWRLICDSGHNGGRIGAQFLRENQDLLLE
jgi:putative glycosyltransferase (TIGR04372 family)